MNSIQTVSTAEIMTAGVNVSMVDRWISFIDVKPRTAETYKRSIKLFFAWLAAHGCSAPSRQDILSYREDLERAGKRAATIAGYLAAIKVFFAWTESEGLYENIAVHVKAPRIERNTFKKDYLTSKQAAKLINTAAGDTLTAKRDYAILALMSTAGLRTIEVVRADIGDIRTIGEETALYLQGKGRDDKREFVKLAAPVEEAIRAYLAARGAAKAEEPLFISTGNRSAGRLTTRSISRIVKNHLLQAGLNSDRLTAHSLRHTAATLMLKQGASIQQVQTVLRHRNINTTMIYAHTLDREKNHAEKLAAAAIFGKRAS